MSERGYALALGLVFLMAMTMMGMTFLAMTSTEPRLAHNHFVMTQELYRADAGIEYAVDLAQQSTDWTTLYGKGYGLTTPELGDIAIVFMAPPTAQPWQVIVRSTSGRTTIEALMEAECFNTVSGHPLPDAACKNPKPGTPVVREIHFNTWRIR